MARRNTAQARSRPAAAVVHQRRRLLVWACDTYVYVTYPAVLDVEPHILDVLHRSNTTIGVEVREGYRRTVRAAHRAAGYAVGQKSPSGLAHCCVRLVDLRVVAGLVSEGDGPLRSGTQVIGHVNRHITLSRRRHP